MSEANKKSAIVRVVYDRGYDHNLAAHLGSALMSLGMEATVDSDAESDLNRYRWLKRQDWSVGPVAVVCEFAINSDSLDAKIDQYMGKTQ